MRLSWKSPASFAAQPAPDDAVAGRVAAAVCAVQGVDRAAIAAAYDALAPLDTGDVLAELCLCVDEATAGVDIVQLVKSARLPLPPDPLRLIDAVRARDLPALQAATGQERPEAVFAALMVLAGSLQDARTRA